jgi:hypothetical protein
MFGMFIKGNTKVSNVASDFLNFANGAVTSDPDWVNAASAATDNNVFATVGTAVAGDNWISDVFKATGYSVSPPDYALAVTGIRWRIRLRTEFAPGLSVNDIFQWWEWVNNTPTSLLADFRVFNDTETLFLAEAGSSSNQRTTPMSIENFKNANTGVGFTTRKTDNGANNSIDHYLDYIYAEYDYEF